METSYSLSRRGDDRNLRISLRGAIDLSVFDTLKRSLPQGVLALHLDASHATFGPDVLLKLSQWLWEAGQRTRVTVSPPQLAEIIGELREGARSLRAVADALAASGETSLGLLLVDEQGLVQRANPAARRLLGCAEGQPFPAQGWQPEHPLQGAPRTWRTYRWQAGKVELHLAIAWAQGKRGQLGGGPIGLVLQDLTTLMHQRQHSAWNETLATAAHEIRNPLAAIQGHVQLLMRSPAVQQDQAALLSVTAVLEESNRMQRLVQYYLEANRPLRPRRVDLREVVARTVKRLQRTEPGAVVEVTGAERILLEADPDRLEQAFFNLGMNAIQAMAGQGRVSFTLQEERSWCHVEVRDEGPGIPSELIGHLFEPFTTGKAKGTGLGLVVSRRVAEAHGGALKLLHTGPTGTAFRLSLPR